VYEGIIFTVDQFITSISKTRYILGDNRMIRMVLTYNTMTNNNTNKYCAILIHTFILLYYLYVILFCTVHFSIKQKNVDKWVLLIRYPLS